MEGVFGGMEKTRGAAMSTFTLVLFAAAGCVIAYFRTKWVEAKQLLLACLFFFFKNVWCIRNAACIRMSERMQEVLYGSMTFAEMVVGRAVHTLQNFSMDREYALFLQVKALFPVVPCSLRKISWV